MITNSSFPCLWRLYDVATDTIKNALFVAQHYSEYSQTELLVDMPKKTAEALLSCFAELYEKMRKDKESLQKLAVNEKYTLERKVIEDKETLQNAPQIQNSDLRNNVRQNISEGPSTSVAAGWSIRQKLPF
eukprot:Filipodium_phascolosomae@DN6162_c0_g1_i1.p1